MKKLFIVSLFLLAMLTACESDEPFAENVGNETPVLSEEKGFYLKKTFGIALAELLEEDCSARKLIKDEASKMFDKDYDILYHLIKGEKLSNGLTFREALLKYYENELDLVLLENGNPLLTIFVPELPENSFSAELWDIEKDIPLVALSSNETNDIIYFDSKGTENIIDAQYIPAFPVVAVKTNERVVVASDDNLKSSTRLKSANSDIEFMFIDEAFDNTIGKAQLKSSVSDNIKNTRTVADEKVGKAYEVYEAYKAATNEEGWYRDYIYYNITPGNQRGQFCYDYQECITTFKLIGDMDAYNKISNTSEDPQIITSAFHRAPGWTEGFFEFKVRALINSSNGLGSEIISIFPLKPAELFDIKYAEMIVLGSKFYMLASVTSKEVFIAYPLIHWDLNQYASTIKIEIEEIDINVTEETTDTRTVKFATNFEISPNYPKLLEKVGLKFGPSTEVTETQTIKKTHTKENDELGSVIVNFADKILLSYWFKSDNDLYVLPVYRKYSSGGWFEIEVRPIKVQ